MNSAFRRSRTRPSVPARRARMLCRTFRPSTNFCRAMRRLPSLGSGRPRILPPRSSRNQCRSYRSSVQSAPCGPWWYTGAVAARRFSQFYRLNREMGESRQVFPSETGIGSSDALKSSFGIGTGTKKLRCPQCTDANRKPRPRSNETNAALRALRRAADSAKLSAKLVKNAELKIYKGAP